MLWVRRANNTSGKYLTKTFICNNYLKLYFSNVQSIDTMVTQEHIYNFSVKLTEILNSELRLGNEIVETYKGWPAKETIMIFLEKPFINSYKLNDIDYRDINDIHYWKAEYFEKSTGHILACRFGMVKHQ